MIVAHKVHRRHWDSAERDFNITVSYHQDVAATEFYRLVASAHYVGFLEHHNSKHGAGHSGTSSIPNAFIGGARTIMPARFNEWMGLESAVLLKEGVPILLPTSMRREGGEAAAGAGGIDGNEIDYRKVFQERDRLIGMRNALLDAHLQ
jgi:hypothetical protein